MMVGNDNPWVLTRSTSRRHVLAGLVAFVATWILFPRRALGAWEESPSWRTPGGWVKSGESPSAGKELVSASSGRAGELGKEHVLACSGRAGVMDARGASLQSDGCPSTPPQTEGPYYPPKAQIDAQRDKDGDLTQLQGQTGRAAGVVLYVLGQVRDAECRPISDATVEIWQASENGRYRHPRDRDNPAPLDPNFQYWGRSVTDRDGRYLLKTIKPGAYQAGPGWIRPPHIHFKVSHPGFRDFITQMYFAGDPHQSDDYILNKVPSDQRDRVIVTMEKPDKDFEPDARVCRFDLTLSR